MMQNNDQGKAPAANDASDASETLAYTPIHALAERLRAGSLSAAALLDCYLARIRRHDGKLHAFVAVYEDEARAAAEVADRALRCGRYLGPLHGIPIALKDLVEIEGRTATAGSMYWRERTSAVTATIGSDLMPIL